MPKLLKTAFRGQRILWVIIALGVAARIGSALYQGNTVQPLPGVFDQVSYHNLAVRVLEGHGFSFGTGWWPATPANQPTAHWSYLYVLFLTGVYSVAGQNPLVPRLIQAVLAGILHPLIVWRISRRLFGGRVALVSAGLTSFYAYFVFYAGALVTESFCILAILWALDVATALAGSSNLRRGVTRLMPWVQLGIALGLATLFRQTILLIVPAILGWLAWRMISRGHSANEPGKNPVLAVMARVAVSVAILIAFVLPWTIRNYRAFGQFVLLNTNAGFAFFWGNHPIHGTHFVPILPGDGSEYGALIPEELHGLNEAELDRALLRRGMGFVLESPSRYVLLSVSRAKEYLKFWPSPDSGSLSNYARVLSFGLCFPFLLSGLLLILFRWTGCGYVSGRAGVSLLVLVAGLYSLLHLLIWTLVRYRLPVDAILLPFAALSMVYAWDRVLEISHISRLSLRKTVN